MIPSAVFFDMDGTLLDSEPIWFQSEKDLMGRFGYLWTESDQKETVGGPLLRVGKVMSEKVGQAQSPEYFAEELTNLVKINFSKDLSFMPGALDLLKDISVRNIPLALVTASPRDLALAAVEALPEPFFDLVVSANDVLHTKPSPDCYLLAAEKLDVQIENCLVLEDTNTGVAAAEGSGAKVIAIPHLVEISERERVKVIKTLTGLTAENLFAIHP